MRTKRLIIVASTAVASLFIPASYQASAAPEHVWDKIAQCESSGRWHINTGNGYYGGLQISHSTWKSYGGQTANAHQASKGYQITVAERIQRGQGWGAWPYCSRRVGVR